MREAQSIINRIIACGHCEVEFLPRTKIKSFKPVITVSTLAPGLGKTQVCRYFTHILNTQIQRKVAVIFPITELDYLTVPREFSVESGLHYVFEPGDDIPPDIFSDSDSWQIKLYLNNGATVYASTDIRRAIILAEQISDVIIYDSRSCEMPNIAADYSFCITSPAAFDNIRKYSLWPGLINFLLSKNVIVVSKFHEILTKERKYYYEKLSDPEHRKIYFVRSSYELEDSSVGLDLFGQKVLAVDHVENIGSATKLATRLGAHNASSIVTSFPRQASPTMRSTLTKSTKNDDAEIIAKINQSDADIIIVSIEKDLVGINAGKRVLHTSPEIEDLDYSLYGYLRDHFSQYQTAPLMSHFSAQADILGTLAHASDRELHVGNNNSANREALCRLFLQSHLSPGFKVTTGEVIDALSNKTGQLDVVVVNDSCPSLTIDTTGSIIAPILADNVLSVIEVKTSLTADQLKKALSQMRPVKALMTTHSTLTNAGGEVIEDPLDGKILTGIFAFNYVEGIEKKVPEIVDLFPGVADFIVLPEYFGYFSVDVLKVCGITVSENDVKKGYKMFTSKGMSLGILFGILNSLAAKRRFSGAYCTRYLNGKWGDQDDQTDRILLNLKENFNMLNQMISKRNLDKENKTKIYQSFGDMEKSIKKNFVKDEKNTEEKK
ncbi:GTPase [Histomonas meleagridis]|uniref:GTPase n=1 Tax=Histomonas meleagridis TaxID=135588 RepID=UPI00355960A7|nr:GTPase [Histomonas meleagridis]KAH0799210.1 GTPase [Histomonas meleagridis]